MKTSPALCVHVPAVLLMLAAACSTGGTIGQNTPNAEMIAFYGHGKLFDRNMNEITPEPALLAEIQNALLEQVHRAGFSQRKRAESSEIQQAEALLNGRNLTTDEALVVRGGIINEYLHDAPEAFRARYSWRNSAIVSSALRNRRVDQELNPTVRGLVLRLYANRGEATDYMDYCRGQGVPIPPDWAESGTEWVMQGSLTENLLDPGKYAAVWTYTDPARRGACIALPRGSGAAGSIAGIICQSATTGAACFWDNKRKGVEPEQWMGWKGQRLVISQLKDGSNLASPCTQCHHGSNAFIISPDDSTWAKVLRVLPTTNPNFTTRVLRSSDNRGGRPRYIPLTTMPARSDWENTYNASTTCAECHEKPAPVRIPNPMPPACAESETSAEECYAP